MAREKTPDRRGALAEPPSEVQVTVVPGARGRAPRELIASVQVVARARAVVGLALAVALVGLALALALAGAINAGPVQDGTGAPRGARAALERDTGPAGVATAYGYPLRCLSVTFSSDRAYARADFDRTSQCGRYDGYVTAIFHRIGGAWRPVLEAVSYSCPVASLPAAVQAALAVCAQTARTPRTAPQDRPRTATRAAHDPTLDAVS